MTKLINFLVKIVLLEVILFTIFRVSFFIAFKDYGSGFSPTDVLYSFWVGFRFDIQVAILIMLPVFLIGGIKYIGIFKSRLAKYFWLIYILVANILAISIYVINFVYFDFFKKLVDSSIVRYFYDIGEAWQMLSEGYPLYSTIAIATVLYILLFIFLKSIYNKINKKDTLDHFSSKKTKFLTYFVFTFIFIFAGYGKLELYPWRWSEAFYSPNTFISYLSSSPVTYFINTLKNKDVKYDIEATKKYYDIVADFLEVDPKDAKKLSLARVKTPSHTKDLTFDKPNIIFILGESTSFARSSISNNPLNPTPFIKYMADNGISYTRYYTPHAGTARSVWTSMTGMSDVERMKTSSRNPMVVEQNMISNSLKDYKKFYFIGGSLSWGNIRGVISNVKNINTFEEHQYKDSPHNDVWGISDVHLASEVNKVLKKQTKPFFAFVQLSGNHSPNTIPSENFGFEFKKDISKDKLAKYAFDGGLNDYNGQRFLDHSVKRLITLAKKEKYFKNTIFIFVGDHGLPKKAVHVHQAEQTFSTHTIHTPLVFYAPYLIKKQLKKDYPVSEVDIMATVAGLTGDKYINSTFGRDILDKNFDQKEHFAFYMTHEPNPKINLIAKEYILRMRADGSGINLFKYYFKDKPIFLNKQYPKLTQHMADLCRGIYENTRYTRYNDSTKQVLNQIKMYDTNSSKD